MNKFVIFKRIVETLDRVGVYDISVNAASILYAGRDSSNPANSCIILQNGESIYVQGSLEEVTARLNGIKSNGSPYPTKEANFGQPHWKPSKEQMEALKYALGKGGAFNKEALEGLYEQLEKL